MSLEARLSSLEKKLDHIEHRNDSQKNMDRFKELIGDGIPGTDIIAITEGRWEDVQSPLLRRSREDPVHRARWDAAAPVLLKVLIQEAQERSEREKATPAVKEAGTED